MGAVALTLGILGIFLFAFPVVGLLAPILAIIFAILGIRKAESTEGKKGKGVSIAGLVLGIIGLAFGALSHIYYGAAAAVLAPFTSFF
jgi:hypothetical protein